MHRHPALATLAVALALSASAASAQWGSTSPPTVDLHNALSPSLMAANRYVCNVMNLSSQTLTLLKLELVSSGQVLASASCAGTKALVPGNSCVVVWNASSSSTWGVPVQCRAQHLGPEAALAGSMQAFLQTATANRSIGAVALQPVTGIALAP